MSSLIKLTGKYATGAHEFAIVDDDMFLTLSAHHWKAKPNASGTHIYAVRNITNRDGSCTMLRMHRVVLGYEGNLDVDHRDGNPLNNTRANLRAVTRSVNGRNRRIFSVCNVCCDCGARFETANRSNAPPDRCPSCQETNEIYAPRSYVAFLTCACGSRFLGKTPTAAHCSTRCKERENTRAKRQRRKEETGLCLSPAHLARNRERARLWRLMRTAT
jgi:predicted Zn-ribbon and HTH transcriptional regulator